MAARKTESTNKRQLACKTVDEDTCTSGSLEIPTLNKIEKVDVKMSEHIRALFLATAQIQFIVSIGP